MRLCWRLILQPVRWRSEIHSPEMRRRRKEFHADTLALFDVFANEDHAAFLLFLRERICEDQHSADGQLCFQIEQSTMRVNHNGLAGLAKFAAQGVLAFGGNLHAFENARTASWRFQ